MNSQPLCQLTYMQTIYWELPLGHANSQTGTKRYLGESYLSETKTVLGTALKVTLNRRQIYGSWERFLAQFNLLVEM